MLLDQRRSCAPAFDLSVIDWIERFHIFPLTSSAKATRVLREHRARKRRPLPAMRRSKKPAMKVIFTRRNHAKKRDASVAKRNSHFLLGCQNRTLFDLPRVVAAVKCSCRCRQRQTAASDGGSYIQNRIVNWVAKRCSPICSASSCVKLY